MASSIAVLPAKTIISAILTSNFSEIFFDIEVKLKLTHLAHLIAN